MFDLNADGSISLHEFRQGFKNLALNRPALVTELPPVTTNLETWLEEVWTLWQGENRMIRVWFLWIMLGFILLMFFSHITHTPIHIYIHIPIYCYVD